MIIRHSQPFSVSSANQALTNVSLASKQTTRPSYGIQMTDLGPARRSVTLISRAAALCTDIMHEYFNTDRVAGIH